MFDHSFVILFTYSFTYLFLRLEEKTGIKNKMLEAPYHYAV